MQKKMIKRDSEPLEYSIYIKHKCPYCNIEIETVDFRKFEGENHIANTIFCKKCERIFELHQRIVDGRNGIEVKQITNPKTIKHLLPLIKRRLDYGR